MMSGLFRRHFRPRPAVRWQGENQPTDVYRRQRQFLPNVTTAAAAARDVCDAVIGNIKKRSGGPCFSRRLNDDHLTKVGPRLAIFWMTPLEEDGQ